MRDMKNRTGAQNVHARFSGLVGQAGGAFKMEVLSEYDNVP